MIKLSRRTFNAALGFGALSTALPGISFAQTTPVRGGTARIVAASEPAMLIELFQNTGNAGVGSRVIEGLLKVNFDRTFKPHLAESWDISADGKTYTFHLRPDIKWHDGQPFTSADVAFSLLTLKETHPRRRVTFASLEKIDTPDPLTVVAHFKTPVPFLLPALTGIASPIIPKRLYEGTDIRANPYNAKPIGTGPYVFKEWERGSHILLERNPDYWIKDLPLLDAVVTRFIVDVSARGAAFEAGDVDVGYHTPVPLDEIKRLGDDPRFGVETRGYELEGSLNQLFFRLDHPILSDLRVRQAFAHAINIDDYIRLVWKGYAVPSPTAIAPSMAEYHDPSIGFYAFDKAKAEALLDEAGHKRGGDGKRFALRLTYNPVYGPTRVGAEFLRSAFGDIGVDVAIQSYDYATYIKSVYTDAAFDIDLQHLANGYDPTDGIQRGYWSKNIKKGVPWSNHSGYSNAEVDEIFEKGSIEIDPAKRKEYFIRFQHILHRDLPAVNLVQFQNLTLYRKTLHNHTEDSSGHSVDFADAWLGS
ncbi:ABC transporter substrate-binding protein [Agrobacterium vitis]|uniref:ABC transporter substrate-binding protein n=1 Tax=Agrobacterium vitis TaxID=373 RepID=A0A368NII6_AGRVI|nr:ABC transporter substrate-binding protein [Agrobacterium vitis]KAA3509330.1 ABC transporter substrate-binding protein [Agrobacterium vitis]KAA3522372.1 ABC transporter substrate-binding protein [Agrobacterium vitis]MCF1479557.1 ABC transporter substrate-binding protein [Agrobacterium vitis]MUZ98288.1 ABC transporter substrate-binding protein [Agrobacterium vitis]NOJ37434.1 ABC transporter substrate-binding protein [Agrobacterium vitis]